MMPTTVTIAPPAAILASKSWLALINAITTPKTIATVTIPPTVSVDRLNGVCCVNGSTNCGAGFGNVSPQVNKNLCQRRAVEGIWSTLSYWGLPRLVPIGVPACRMAVFVVLPGRLLSWVVRSGK